MAFAPLEFVKKHPLETGGVVLVGGIALVLLLGSRGSAAQTVASSPNAISPNAELQAATQLAAIQSQTQAQNAQINGQIALAQQQGANDIALATIQAHTTNTQNQLDAAISALNSNNALNLGQTQSNNATTVSLAGLSTQSAINANNNATQQNIAKIVNQAAVDTVASNNATQQFVAGTVAQTQQALGAQAANVAIAQTNANVSIAKINNQGSIWRSVIGVAPLLAAGA